MRTCTFWRAGIKNANAKANVEVEVELEIENAKVNANAKLSSKLELSILAEPGQCELLGSRLVIFACTKQCPPCTKYISQTCISHWGTS